ncbi:MAG: hypothetical protein J5545_02665, partial [Bacteroidaceae bacterium]|nr:hypothetical protein [Bacteroidaceae bacterium]
KTRAFRYATTDPSRVPTARIPFATTLPANELAGYPYQMPTALTHSHQSNAYGIKPFKPLSNAYGINPRNQPQHKQH